MRRRLLIVVSQLAAAALAFAATAWSAEIGIEVWGLNPQFAFVADGDSAHWTNRAQDTQNADCGGRALRLGAGPTRWRFQPQAAARGQPRLHRSAGRIHRLIFVAGAAIQALRTTRWPTTSLTSRSPKTSSTIARPTPSLGIGGSKTRILVLFGEGATVAEANDALRDADVS